MHRCIPIELYSPRASINRSTLYGSTNPRYLHAIGQSSNDVDLNNPEDGWQALCWYPFGIEVYIPGEGLCGSAGKDISGCIRWNGAIEKCLYHHQMQKRFAIPINGDLEIDQKQVAFLGKMDAGRRNQREIAIHWKVPSEAVM